MAELSFPVKLVKGPLSIEFSEAGGGFPTLVRVNDFDGVTPELFKGEKSFLEIDLADGRTLTTTQVAASYIHLNDRKGATYLNFDRMGFKDQDGKVMEDFFISLQYEIFSDGTLFTYVIFEAVKSICPEIKRFELKMPLQLQQFDQVNWSLCYRPRAIDGTIIQTSAPERFLNRGENREIECGIFPLVGFNCATADGPSLYAEFFVEGDNVLSNCKDDNCSSVKWNGENVDLSWNFQKIQRSCRNRPWQWRNYFGWCIVPAARRRHLPPLTMYHYFDNAKHYPSCQAMQGIADAGADLVIIHENWRMDIQNGGVPYDQKRFADFVDQARNNGIRVATYMRGNEDSAVHYACEWFYNELKQNFDGLYMDYGGPFHHATPPDEYYHSGRICFRRHYRCLKKLRETVGRDGVFYGHTGPMFSALGMVGDNLDGYVSGEGERGLLIKGRREHLYFSMASVCPGSMWTAAFPEYSSPQMIPFLAAAGQTPHSTLGVQFPTSSLSHPPEPGVNDVNFRPLWKLWKFFKDERDVSVYNDYNSCSIFSGSDRETGHYLMISPDGRKALLVLANFSAENKSLQVKVDWVKANFRCNGDVSGVALQPRVKSPGKAVAAKLEELKLDVEGYGVGGFYFVSDPTEDDKFNERIAAFEKAYPVTGAEGVAWEKNTSEQLRLRKNPPQWKELYLSASVPELVYNYEESMVWDLYDNQFELGKYVDGEFVHVGWIGKNGFQTEPTKRPDFIWPGEESKPTNLRDVLGAGHHKLALRSLHLGDLYYQGVPFYSFMYITLSPSAKTNDPQAYRLEFDNLIEPDRAFMNWEVDLI